MISPSQDDSTLSLQSVWLVILNNVYHMKCHFGIDRQYLALYPGSLRINSLWPSDAIWWHKSEWTWAQVIVWCLTVPSHYLNQCCLITGVLWHSGQNDFTRHYSDVIMGAMASHITDSSIVYLTVCSGADQRKHQSSALLSFARGIHGWPVNFPNKRPVTRKMFLFDYVIIKCSRT